MSVLRAIERKIEGLFEGVFGRAFRTHVQPVELARKLAKEMDEHRSVSVSRVYVPNEYSLYLSPTDREQFASYEGSLVGELQEYLAEHARREGYALMTPPRVLVLADPDLAVGEFGISTRMVEPDSIDGGDRSAEKAAGLGVSRDALPSPVGVAVTPPVTMIYRPDEPLPTPVPVLDVVTLALDGRPLKVARPKTVIGRSRECEIRLDDENVSRRHCEVVEGSNGWTLVDLGSTNGTELNGRRVNRAELSDGDTITVGGSDLIFGLKRP
jgi:pSer/pThr/pTyr-binding forkhead associated (FHA) protein